MAKLHEKYYKHRDIIRELLSGYETNSAEDLTCLGQTVTSLSVILTIF